MKRYKNFVIGGIETKVISLILVSMLLVAGVFWASMSTQRQVLSSLSQETNDKQIAAMTGTTAQVIESIIDEKMNRSTELEAMVTDEMFMDLGIRVRMVADSAKKLLSDPDHAPRARWYRPSAIHDGELFPKILLAPGLKVSDVSDRLGLIANLSDQMISVCQSYGSDNLFFTLPEGVTLMVDKVPGFWFEEDGSYVTYDATNRYWYNQAVEAGEMVYSDVEYDHRNGALCVTCAQPVYASDGSLLGVAGADLYLNDMQKSIMESASNSSFLVIVNQSGHVIISPRRYGVFKAMSSADAADLRQSSNSELAQLVTDSMKGPTGLRSVTLDDGNYYMTGIPMKTVGWALIAVYRAAEAEQPLLRLEADYGEIQQEAVELYYAESSRSKVYMWSLLGILLIAMLFGAFYFGRRIVKPLNTMTNRIALLNENNLEFKMEDDFRTGDEVEALAERFAEITHREAEYFRTIKDVTAEKERIKTELGLAAQIQSAMLPHKNPAFPERRDFDIIGCMDPAKEVGGDFFDYFLVDEDHLGIVIADVSGKGVPAALFMMASKIILQSVAMLGGSPSEILTKTNQAICSSNEAQMFVTVWVGLLELSTGKMMCANAGHEYPVFKKPDGAFELFKDKHGFVLGGMDGLTFSEYEVRLEPGSKIFVYTDGVPEATNASLELFGTDRLIEALNSNPDASPADVLKDVRTAVDNFVLDAEQFDDLTMICLEYKGPQP